MILLTLKKFRINIEKTNTCLLAALFVVYSYEAFQ